MSGVSETCKTTENTAGWTVPLILMNIWCYGMLALWTLLGILSFPLVIVLCLIILRWSTGRLMRWYIWIYGRGWLLLMSPFVRFRREQMEHAKPGQPCLFIVNHLSFFDTYCMAMLPVHDIIFAVRAWPFKMFWYATFMRLARYMNVEESSWEETLENCHEAFANNGAVLFFPEGSRSRTGELQRFYSGGFKAAIESKIPLVPLVIDGTDILLPPGRKQLRPCRIKLRALAPIDTTEFSGNDGPLRLRKLAKEQMAEALVDMRRDRKDR